MLKKQGNFEEDGREGDGTVVFKLSKEEEQIVEIKQKGARTEG